MTLRLHTLEIGTCLKIEHIFFHAVVSLRFCFLKSPLKCFETRSVILCGDVTSTETGRQGGTRDVHFGYFS